MCFVACRILCIVIFHTDENGFSEMTEREDGISRWLEVFNQRGRILLLTHTGELTPVGHLFKEHILQHHRNGVPLLE